VSSSPPTRNGCPPTAEPDTAALHRRARGENFTVASYLLPTRIRRRLMSIYAFARLVDDIGDEIPGNRMVLFDKVSRDLDRLYAGFVPPHQLYRDLAATINECRVPREPFDQLIAANRQDQVVRTYATFEDLLAYCDLSANPVGHLVLYVLEAATPERMARSDGVCTGLQLAEHWQDVAEDFRRGRIYLPQEDLARFGCSEADLGAPRAGDALRRLMAFEVERARDLLGRGAPLARDLGGRAGLAVAAFVAGGHSALDAIGRAGYDVLSGTPRAGKARRSLDVLRTIGALWISGSGRR
jgi:squalene synthase HpnC